MVKEKEPLSPDQRYGLWIILILSSCVSAIVITVILGKILDDKCFLEHGYVRKQVPSGFNDIWVKDEPDKRMKDEQ